MNTYERLDRGDAEIASLRADLAAAREEVERLEVDLADTRNSHAKLMRAIKAALGFKNWPKIEGNVVDGVCALLADATTRALAAEREVEEKERLIAAWNETINAMGERCKAAERARDEAVQAGNIACLDWAEKYDAITRERDEALAALRALARTVDEKGVGKVGGTPCWCAIPSMIPYRGHDADCEEAARVLSPPAPSVEEAPLAGQFSAPPVEEGTRRCPICHQPESEHLSVWFKGNPLRECPVDPRDSVPPAPPPEAPARCPDEKCKVHGDKWIEGTPCPAPCGGRRVWHDGLGETTTDIHWRCEKCGEDRYVDGIDA